jgi:hypothetical protein
VSFFRAPVPLLLAVEQDKACLKGGKGTDEDAEGTDGVGKGGVGVFVFRHDIYRLSVIFWGKTDITHDSPTR